MTCPSCFRPYPQECFIKVIPPPMCKQHAQIVDETQQDKVSKLIVQAVSTTMSEQNSQLNQKINKIEEHITKQDLILERLLKQVEDNQRECKQLSQNVAMSDQSSKSPQSAKDSVIQQPLNSQQQKQQQVDGQWNANSLGQNQLQSEQQNQQQDKQSLLILSQIKEMQSKIVQTEQRFADIQKSQENQQQTLSSAMSQMNASLAQFQQQVFKSIEDSALLVQKQTQQQTQLQLTTLQQQFQQQLKEVQSVQMQKFQQLQQDNKNETQRIPQNTQQNTKNIQNQCNNVQSLKNTKVTPSQLLTQNPNSNQIQTQIQDQPQIQDEQQNCSNTTEQFKQHKTESQILENILQVQSQINSQQQLGLNLQTQTPLPPTSRRLNHADQPDQTVQTLQNSKPTPTLLKTENNQFQQLIKQQEELQKSFESTASLRSTDDKPKNQKTPTLLQTNYNVLQEYENKLLKKVESACRSQKSVDFGEFEAAK